MLVHHCCPPRASEKPSQGQASCTLISQTRRLNRSCLRYAHGLSGELSGVGETCSSVRSEKTQVPGPHWAVRRMWVLGLLSSLLCSWRLRGSPICCSPGLHLMSHCCVSEVLSLCSPCFLSRTVASFPCFQLLFPSFSLASVFLPFSCSGLHCFLPLCSVLLYSLPSLPSISSIFSKFHTLFPISLAGLLPLQAERLPPITRVCCRCLVKADRPMFMSGQSWLLFVVGGGSEPTTRAPLL